MPALRTGSRSLDATSPSSSPSPSPPSSLPSTSSPSSHHEPAPAQTLTAPALQLISPTPRTVMFPTSHNLSLPVLDGSSPYSSPSHSPFQGADEYTFPSAHGHGHALPPHDGGFGAYDHVKFTSDFDGAVGGYDDPHTHTRGYTTPASGFTFMHPNASQQSFVSVSASTPSFGYSNPGANASVQSFHSGSYVLASPLEGPYSSVDLEGSSPKRNGNANGSQLSLTIPELPSFTSPTYAAASSPSDTGSLRSASPSGSIRSLHGHNQHRRRKSSSSVHGEREPSVERRPKKGDADYVKRPENAFILFRRAQCEERQALETASQNSGAPPAKKQRQADLSKSISERWRNLSAEEKKVWEGLAKEKKEEHAKANPGYVYRPERKSKKGSSSSTSGASSSTTRRSSLSRARRASEDSNTSLDSPHLSVFVPMRMPSSHGHSHSHSASVSLSGSSSNSLQPSAGPHRNTGGRSSSAPRPYGRIDFPMVQHGVGRYKREGSEPTSPSLVPLINEHSRMGGAWDYVPPVQKGFGGVADSEYPSMSMVSSLFAHQPASAPVRKSSAPSPLSLISPPATASPLSLIVPPSSSTPASKSAPATTRSNSAPTTTSSSNDAGSDEGSASTSSSESGNNSPFTPSTTAPMFMMPNFETLLEPPSESAFEASLANEALPSSHMADVSMDGMGLGMGMGYGMDAMDMNFGSGFGAFGGEFGAGMTPMEGIDASGSAFGASWDWPVSGGLGMDNNWDVGSIPVASLGSSVSPPPTSSGSVKHEALVSKFSGLGVSAAAENGKASFESEEGMFGVGDPTLVGVGGYDDILAGGAFA